MLTPDAWRTAVVPQSPAAFMPPLSSQFDPTV